VGPAVALRLAPIVSLAGLLGLALAVRWPELAMVPQFTDEIREVARGGAIARGELLPLTNFTPHIGALFNYLVAAALWLVGPRLEVGRLVVLAFGVLTVLPTYLLGRRLGNQAVGLLAAALLAVSATHIAVSSHIAYSQSLTPFFVTTSLWLLQRAIGAADRRALVASGAAFGLAVQLHPAALALAPGLAVYALLRGRRLGRWTFVLSVLAALLVLSNLVVFNLQGRMAGLGRAASRIEQYTTPESEAEGGWPARFGLLINELFGALAGLVGESPQPMLFESPEALLWLGLLLLGLGWLARRREWLLLAVIVSGLLFISLLNGRLAPIVVRARHYALLLPAAYVAVAVALVGLYGWLRGRLVGRLTLVACAVGLLIAPLWHLQTYYRWAYDQGHTNQVQLASDSTLRQLTNTGETVLVDRSLLRVPTLSGGVSGEAPILGLELRRQPLAVLEPADLAAILNRISAGSPVLLLHRDTAAALSQRFALTPLSPRSAANDLQQVVQVRRS
jgi:4-amino-4-deoxy-L-arabinose transferase-like glycosyltransferase